MITLSIREKHTKINFSDVNKIYSLKQKNSQNPDLQSNLRKNQSVKDSRSLRLSVKN
jgi:hypothetical protein